MIRLVAETVAVLVGTFVSSPPVNWIHPAPAAPVASAHAWLDAGICTRLAHPPTPDPRERLDTHAAEPETARAFSRAASERGILERGQAWVGKLDSLARQERDTIVYVPDALDPTRPIELVIYMEGYGSFSRQAMDQRHAAGIAALVEEGQNFVYVAPDVPSSSLGPDPTHKGVYWSERCASADRCHDRSAPGDFIAFYRDATDKARHMIARHRANAPAVAPLCPTPEPRFSLTLIGFSNGGNGVHAAVTQLSQGRDGIDLETVGLGRVIFADAIYSQRWLSGTWERVRHLPSLHEFSILLRDGAFPGHGAGRRNRANAQDFMARYRPDIDLAAIRAPGQTVDLGVLRVSFMRASHDTIGDRAVYFRPLPSATEPASRIVAAMTPGSDV